MSTQSGYSGSQTIGWPVGAGPVVRGSFGPTVPGGLGPVDGTIKGIGDISGSGTVIKTGGSYGGSATLDAGGYCAKWC